MNDWDEAISDFLACMKTRYKPTTLAWYGYILRPLATWAIENHIPLADFKRRHFDRYLATRVDHVGKRSLEVSGRCTRVFVRYCCQTDYLKEDVLKEYVVTKSPKPHVRKPTSEDLQKLLRAIEQRMDVRTNPNVRGLSARNRRFLRTRDYALLSGLIETGCRVSELCQLRLDDFDADDDHVRRKEPRRAHIAFRQTKTGEPRQVPVSETWVLAVKEWLKIRPAVKDCPTLFLSERGLAMDKNSTRKRLNAYLEFAGLKHFTQHSLRHYTATEMAKVNVVSAARILGHDRLETTMGYLHADPDQVRADHATANPLGKILQQSAKPTAAKTRRKKVI